MWKAWWTWAQLWCRQAEFRNGASSCHLPDRELNVSYCTSDLDRFYQGLAKIRKAREAFPSLAWGKQVEAEFLYHIGMRATSVRIPFASLSCYAYREPMSSCIRQS